jgi:hypothetical protein
VPSAAPAADQRKWGGSTGGTTAGGVQAMKRTTMSAAREVTGRWSHFRSASGEWDLEWASKHIDRSEHRSDR